MAAKKNETKQPGKTELIKSISTLLDETIAEVESMAKGDVSFKDLKLQPDENGDMPKEASSSSDQFQSMKKEDEESDSEDDKKKKKDDDDEEEEEEDAKKSEEEVDPKYEEFKGNLSKALIELGLLSPEGEEEVAKSEDESDSEDMEKSESEEDDELTKALETRDAEVKELKEQVKGLTDTVEKFSRIPQGRRSISGLRPIMKSENDANSDGGSERSLNKGEVLDKLIDMQRGGDKRVTPQLVAKYELSGDPKLVQDILTGK